MSLDMLSHIDDTFVSTDSIAGATRYAKSGGSYVDGIWVEGVETPSTHTVNLQPLSDREIQNLSIDSERITDYRKVYVNDGDLYSIREADEWEFDNVDGRFKAHALDNRPTRNYCRIIAVRIDDSDES